MPIKDRITNIFGRRRIDSAEVANSSTNAARFNPTSGVQALSAEEASRCEKCRRILIQRQELDHKGINKFVPYDHHASFSNLVAAADAGCNLCRLFSDRLGYVIAKLPNEQQRAASKAKIVVLSHEELEWGSGSLGEAGEGTTRLKVVLMMPREGDGRPEALAAVEFGLFIDPGPHEQENSIVLGRPISSDPTSHACIQLMQTWLRQCSSSHPKCRSRRPDYFPTRVINIGTAGNLHEPILQVNPGSMKGRYAALSHCWGGASVLTTTTANIEMHQREIPISSMPANFRDAVWVARCLGLQYIWIDSLCIVQDSKRDWEAESERMGDVYGNAFVTIAAAAAKDSNAGFLKPRPAQVVTPIACIPRSLPGRGGLPDVHLRELPLDWKRGIELAVLNRRGWTLQERLLAPRILHVGQDQLFWECEELSAAEGGLKPDGGNPDVFSKATLGSFWNELQEGSFADVMQRWYASLDEYSTRNLTHGSDKLPAMAGIAKSMRDQWPALGQYVCGVWTGDFARGLLWRARSVRGLSRPAQRRAPSWSWSAWDGSIKHDWDDLKHYDARKFPLIQNIKIELQGKSPYGQVGAGWVRLKAPMRPGVYYGTPPHGGPTILGPDGRVLRSADDPEHQWYDLFHVETDSTSWQPVGSSLCRAYFDEAPVQGRMKPYVLMLMGEFSWSVWPEHWWEEIEWGAHWALILEPCEGRSEEGQVIDTVRRVGVARMWDKKSFQGWGAVSKMIL